ncbi:hypothetical protein QCE47_16425 [Caballeronia sp. LZ025]|uniref:hypothetical protein n=1 Tax=Caballeronia TaxID=1827195 RepID=UPI001FD205F5|nr:MULTISPECIES: hypothetical protein [Caballeronia]MDR5733912.1 hypothetical protein [Caballeronia sp. LZ025]
MIAEALPQSSSADVQETLHDLIGETASADLPGATRDSMHAVVRQIIDSMEIGLRR